MIARASFTISASSTKATLSPLRQWGRKFPAAAASRMIHQCRGADRSSAAVTMA